MASRLHSTSRPRTIAALAAALALLLAPAAAHGAAAVDEYSLGPIGGQNATKGDVQRDSGAGAKATPDQRGVVGENEPGRSPLAAAGAGAWIGLALLLVAAITVLSWPRPPRSAA